MNKAKIHDIFRQSRGLSWAARALKVDKSILSRWLRGEKRSFDLDKKSVRVEELARQLVATEGKAAKGDLNGPSVRARVGRLRRGRRVPSAGEKQPREVE